MTKAFYNPATFYHKITDISTGEIVAYAHWQFPYSGPVENDKDVDEQPNRMESFPEGSNIALVKGYYSALDDKMAKYADPEKDYGEQDSS